MYSMGYTETLQMYRQEALRQQLVKSEGIVKVLMEKVFPLPEKNIFVIAYELMDRELKVPKEGYKPEEALDILKKILRSYSSLYKRGMTHRDLKPQNFLTKEIGDKMIIKISDFGTAK